MFNKKSVKKNGFQLNGLVTCSTTYRSGGFSLKDSTESSLNELTGNGLAFNISSPLFRMLILAL